MALTERTSFREDDGEIDEMGVGVGGGLVVCGIAAKRLDRGVFEQEAGEIGDVVEVAGIHLPGGVEVLTLLIIKTDGIDRFEAVLRARHDTDRVGNVVGSGIHGGGCLDFGVLIAPWRSRRGPGR